MVKLNLHYILFLCGLFTLCIFTSLFYLLALWIPHPTDYVALNLLGLVAISDVLLYLTPFFLLFGSRTFIIFILIQISSILPLHYFWVALTVHFLLVCFRILHLSFIFYNCRWFFCSILIFSKFLLVKTW